MAQRFLTSINLSSNELQNALLHPLATPPAVGSAGKVYYNTVENILYVSDGTSWKSVSGDITSITGGNGISTSETSGIVTVSLDDTSVIPGEYGSETEIAKFTVDQQGRITSANSTPIASTLTFLADTGSVSINYINESLDVLGGDGIETSASPNGISITVDGTVVRTSGDQSIDGNKTFNNDLVIGGNLTVSGNVTSVNTEEINLADNVIRINSNATGTPTENGGIDVERGDSENVSLLWNESTDKWTFTNDGTNYFNIPTPSDYAYSWNVSDGNASSSINDGDSLSFISGNGISVFADFSSGNSAVIQYSHGETSSVSNVDNSGLSVVQDITFDQYGHVQSVGSIDLTSDIESLITNSISSNSYSELIGDGNATSFTVFHDLGTLDVIVQLVETVNYETVFADVQRSTINAVSVNFSSAPLSNEIKVLIIKVD